MRDEEQPDRLGEDANSHPDAAPAGLSPVESEAVPDDADTPLPDNTDDDEFSESLTEEIAALIDDGRTYAEAELAFQKRRAGLAGRKVGGALIFAILALILLHLMFIALAVGMVIALEPLVTIWGAIGIVVGVLLLGVIGLLLLVRSNALGLVALFMGDDEA